MSNDHTSGTAVPSDNQHGDLAPTAATMPQIRADLPAQGEATPPAFAHLDPVKRKKTAGEVLFNLGTYGGFSTLGNEALSILIMQSAGKGLLKKPYDAFAKFFTESKGLSKLSPYIKEGRLPYLLFATIGGWFTVFPVKAAEDRKGSIVRTLDHWIHGNKVETDPKYVEAHKEMDEAPKQSWGSLGKGRVVTVIAAAVVDYLIGWKDALSSRLLKNTRLKNYSSLNNASESVATKLVDNVFKVAPQNRAKWFEWAVTGGWLLTLSTTLTVLFYASSKMFAQHSENRREERLEKQLQNAGLPANASQVDLPSVTANDNFNAINDNQGQPIADRPSPKVNQIARIEHTLQPMPEPAMGA